MPGVRARCPNGTMAETSPGSVSRQREFIATALPEIAATFVDIPDSSFCFFSGFHGGERAVPALSAPEGRGRGFAEDGIRCRAFEIRRSRRSIKNRRDVLTSDRQDTAMPARYSNRFILYLPLPNAGTSERGFFGVRSSPFSCIGEPSLVVSSSYIFIRRRSIAAFCHE